MSEGAIQMAGGCAQQGGEVGFGFQPDFSIWAGGLVQQIGRQLIDEWEDGAGLQMAGGG